MKVNTNQMPDEKPNKKQSKEKTPKQKPEKFDYIAAIKERMKKPENANGSEEQTDKIKAKWNLNELMQQKKFWIILIIVLFMIFLSINSNMTKAKTQLSVQLKRTVTETDNLNTAISEVQADLEEQARIDALKLTDEEETLARHTATEQGIAVETLQNQYKKYENFDLIGNTNNMTPEEKAAWSAEYDAFKAIGVDLDPYFGENDKSNGKVNWYSRVGVYGTWKFETLASFTGNTAKALWLCRDDDNTLLGYVTATYNADTKLFTNVVVKQTKYAEAIVASMEYDNDEQPFGDVESMAESLQQLKENGDIKTSEDQVDENAMNSNREITDDYKNAAFDGRIDDEEIDDNYRSGLSNYADDNMEVYED